MLESDHNTALIYLKPIYNQAARIMDLYRTKKISLFGTTRRKRVKDLLTQLSDRDISHQKMHIEELLRIRKKKLRNIRDFRHREISQPTLQPTKLLYSEFSTVSPVSSGERFLNEKIRLSLIEPDRAFSSAFNMKSGSIKEFPKPSPFLDKQVINKKFKEYDRLVNEQSGSYRKKVLEQHKINQIKFHTMSVKERQNPSQFLKEKQPRVKIGMKKTFFMKYPADKYRFYPERINSIKDEVFELTSLRKSSARQRQALLKSIQKSRTIDPSSIGSPTSPRSPRSPRSRFHGSTEQLNYLYSDRQ